MPAITGVEIPVVYDDVESVSIAFANQFTVQVQQDEFILLVGQISPPLLLGSEEERAEQARALEGVRVRTLGRYGLTATRMRELVDLLSRTLAAYDGGREQGS